MKTLLICCALLAFSFGFSQAKPTVKQDAGSKVGLTGDTITSRSTRNLEKENLEVVKTQNHPKVTRNSETARDSSKTNRSKRKK